MCDTFGIDSGYITPTTENYDGGLNYYYQRTGFAEQIWENDNFYQKYKGNFFQDSLHGSGIYTLVHNKESFLIEGSFYANNIDGYATVTYSNGSYFEGLIRKNVRYGPGVLTLTNGTQDVGLWNGTQLIRLCCTVFPEWVPRMARNPSGKIKLLKYRELVPIQDNIEDSATVILQALGAPNSVLELADQLYNPYIRNKESLFFNRKLHDKRFFGKIDCSIEVPMDATDILHRVESHRSMNIVMSNQNIMEEIISYVLENVNIWEEIPISNRANFLYSKILEERERLTVEIDTIKMRELLEAFIEEISNLIELPKGERELIIIKNDILKKLPENWKLPDVPVRKVTVTDLLAWNNEKSAISMMKHTFAHRNFENDVSFKVRKLIIGDRSDFHSAGPQEEACVRFLQECSFGNYSAASNLLYNNNLNPDVCDAKGNSSIMFAAARDKWRVIKMLCNFGANLDMFNDEGLTPLTMCILRYVSEKLDVQDWEQAFLTEVLMTPEELEEAKEWRPHASLCNITSISVPSLTETVILQEDQAIKKRLLEKESLLDALNIDLRDGNLKNMLGDFYDTVKNMQVDMAYMNFQKAYQQLLDPAQKYVFALECILPPPPKRTKTDIKGGSKNKRKKDKLSKSDSKKSKKSAKSNTSKKSSKFNKSETGAKSEKMATSQNRKESAVLKELHIVKENKLKVILTTIKILLNLGADPNYSIIPLPILLMAIYSRSKELLELLIAAGANPNLASIGDDLTPLILLACMPFSNDNTEMFELILGMGGDPNQKVGPNHWVEEKNKLVGKSSLSDIIDNGKTALHILSMRYDFEQDPETNQLKMIHSLLQSQANVHEKYLGHVPFSIAILRGNIKLIRYYIESKQVDPYEALGEKMGTPLTILTLKRYNNVLPVDICRNVYDVLLEYNINPLVDIEAHGNAVEFMHSEYESSSNKKDKGKKEKTKKTKKGKKEKSSTKGSKKKKANPVDEVKDYLVESTRKMLQRYTLSQAFQHLKTFIALKLDPTSEIMQNLLKFFNMRNAVPFLQLLISRGNLEYSKLNLFIVYQLLELVDKNRKSKPSSQGFQKVEDIFKNFKWDIIHIDRLPILTEPEIDENKDKYKVCFYCCQKIDKVLIVCPMCGLVYFCSQECNRLSIREDTIHKCNHLYYDKEKQNMDNALRLGQVYKPANLLQDTLDEVNDMLFKMLKDKYGTEAATAMLANATFNGELNLEALLNMNDALKGAIEKSLGIAGTEISNLHEQLFQGGYAPKGKLSKSRLLDKYGQLIKSSTSEVDEKRKRKSKGSETSLVDEDKVKHKKDKKKDKIQVSKLGESSEKSQRSTKTGKKTLRGRSEEKSSKDRKGYRGRSKETGKKYGSPSGKRGGFGTTKTSKRRIGTKERFGSQVGKGRFGSPTDKGRFGSPTGRGRVDSPTSKWGRYGSPGGKYSREDGKYGSKGKYGSAGGLGGMHGVYDRFGGRRRFGDADYNDEPYYSQGGPGPCGPYIGRKDLDMKTLPNKCQYLLEQLARLFPDFDFSLLLWPYVCYFDGQLYYRFLDRNPLFMETYSNV